jgi:hypothetical protein
LFDEIPSIEIFAHEDRSPGYNSAEDNVVRVQAQELRRRLDIYFYTSGRTEKLRIKIPKGSYVPFFEPNDTPQIVTSSGSTLSEDVSTPREDGGNGEKPATTPAIQDFPEATSISSEKLSLATARSLHTPRRGPWLPLPEGLSHPSGKILWSALALGLAAVLALTVHLGKPNGAVVLRSSGGEPSAAADSFWSALFPSSDPVQIVVSDSCLVLTEDMTHKAVALDEYASSRYLDELRGPELPLIASRHYTDFADLLVTSRILRSAIAQHRTVDITYARSVRARDLDNHNVVFLGSSYSDPWVQEFDDERQFGLAVDSTAHRLCFSNKSPQPGEADRYCTGSADGNEGEAYGLATFLPNLQNNGNVLILEGTNAAGTEVVGTFVTDPRIISEIRRCLGLANGSPIPYFQVLLKTTYVQGAPGRVDLVAHRILSLSNR